MPYPQMLCSGGNTIPLWPSWNSHLDGETDDKQTNVGNAWLKKKGPGRGKQAPNLALESGNAFLRKWNVYQALLPTTHP